MNNLFKVKYFPGKKDNSRSVYTERTYLDQKTTSCHRQITALWCSALIFFQEMEGNLSVPLF